MREVDRDKGRDTMNLREREMGPAGVHRGLCSTQGAEKATEKTGCLS